MGADVRTHHGTPPVEIGGGQTCSGIDYAMPMASAQVKSAILLAALYAEGPTQVTAPAIIRDHSELMLASCGVTVQTVGSAHDFVPAEAFAPLGNHGAGRFFIGRLFYRGGPSGGTGRRLLIRNVGMNPTRTGLLEILSSMGAGIEVLNVRQSGAEPVADLKVRRTELRGVTVPPEQVALAIDEIPVCSSPPPARTARPW